MSNNNVFKIPYALAIGPQRTGTSWIDRYLRARGDVCLPKDVKEIFFFDRHVQRGLKFYKSHFHPQSKHKIVMEVSTTSFDSITAPYHVYDLFGKDVHLICPLRHPVQRSYSLYKHLRRYGMVNGALEEAAQIAPNIITSSYYAQHLQEWFKLFGRENITVLFQEDLQNDPDQYVRNLCDGLGLEFKAAPLNCQGRYNSAAESKIFSLAAIAQKTCDVLRALKLYRVINFGKKIGLKEIVFGKESNEPNNAASDGMSSEERIWLEKRLLPEVKKLETLLGKPIASWHES